MLSYSLNLFFFASVAVTVAATPHGYDANAAARAAHEHYKRCGPVAKYYNPTFLEWQNASIDTWLDNWWEAHLANITSHANGFAGAFAEFAIGNPDFSCKMGSTTPCAFDPCDVRVLNNQDDVRAAYWVLKAVENFHSYYNTINQAYTQAAIQAALTKENWVATFWHDPKKDATGIEFILDAIVPITSMLTAGAGFWGDLAEVAISDTIKGFTHLTKQAVLDATVNTLNTIATTTNTYMQKNLELGK